MVLIALTGGIGSGKSTIAQQLENLGAFTVDADQLSRDAVAPGTVGLAAIAQQFGNEVITQDGSLDRAKLGEIVFRDEKARKLLESIVHPEVQRLASEKFQAFREQDAQAVIVYEIPLLVETGALEGWDEIVLADAPAEVRIRRLIDQRGLEEQDARNRVHNQASDAQRRAVATTIIDTSTSFAETKKQVELLWQTLKDRPVNQ